MAFTIVVCLVGLGATSLMGDNLVHNGNFEEKDANGYPTGW
jgi:hypothetical protein